MRKEDIEAKIEAVRAFTSQERLFGSYPKLARKIRRSARKLGGERVWCRPGSQASLGCLPRNP